METEQGQPAPLSGGALATALSGLPGQQLTGQEWIQAIDTELAQQHHARRLLRRKARRRGKDPAAVVALERSGGMLLPIR